MSNYFKEIQRALPEYKQFADSLHQKIAPKIWVPRTALFLDILWCRIRYKIKTDEYAEYGIYRVNHWGRKNFIPSLLGNKLFSECNDPAYIQFVKNKVLFNKRYAGFIGREWCFVPDCNDEEIIAFMKKYQTIIVKPRDKGRGDGIFKVSFEEISDMDSFITEAKESKYLFEQIIVQHDTLNRINPNSVNTMRINTFITKTGEVRFLSAALRSSSGDGIVDNYYAGGVITAIDLETGILLSNSKSNTTDLLLRHPYSDVVLPGIELPYWSETLAFVKEAAMVTPQLRIIGWDIAITPNGPIIVEANNEPGYLLQRGTEGHKQKVAPH